MDNFRSLNYAVRNVFKILFVALISYQCFRIFFPFTLVLIVAALVALAVEPYVVKLQNRFHFGRGSATLVMMSFFVIIVLLPILLFCLKGSNLIVNNLIPYLGHTEGHSDLLAPFQNYTLKVGGIFNLDTAFINEKLGLALSSLLGFIADLFRTIIAQIPSIVFSMLLFILALAVFMSNFPLFKAFLHRSSNMEEARYNKFIDSIAKSSRVIFVSNILTGFVQASIVSIGALSSGFSEIFLIFFVTLICSFVPLVGAAPIALILSVVGFYKGSVVVGVVMLVVAAIASVSDNIVRSITMSSGNSNMHPFVAFLSVIGGVFAYGMPGLLLGPLVASICFDCLPILIEDLVHDGK